MANVFSSLSASLASFNAAISGGGSTPSPNLAVKSAINDVAESSNFSFIVCCGFAGMADGKSKSDICSDVVDDDTFDDDCRTIGDDDAVRDWKFFTPVVINASTSEAFMAMTAKKWLIESFMVLVPIVWCVYLCGRKIKMRLKYLYLHT